MPAQVRPLNEGLFGLSAQQLQLVKAGTLLLLGALQVANTRPIVQAYLNTAALHWRMLKHGSGGKDVGTKIRQKVQLVSALCVKVRAVASSQGLFH